MLLLPIVGVVAVVWAAVDPANGAVNLNSGVIAVLVGFVLFGVLPYLQTRAVMKTPNFGGVMSLTASDQGIEFTGEHSNARIDWSMVNGVLETHHRILINLRPAGFQVIPKPQLNPADLNAFKDVLRVHANGKVKLANS